MKYQKKYIYIYKYMYIYIYIYPEDIVSYNKIIMKYLKIINLLHNPLNQPSKFRIKKELQ